MTRAGASRAAAPAGEALSERELAARWAAGLAPPLRLEDGRRLQVIFPGVPTGGSGPDFRDAILEAGGDFLSGDVELHLRASSWRGHGHHLDPAYGEVALHAVAWNDGGPLTYHSNGRAIPVLVMPAAIEQGVFPPPFTPPCALEAARRREAGPVLERMGLRRLRAKAAAVAIDVSVHGPGQALYARTLAALGGAPNRAVFETLARRLPLAALLERADAGSQPRREQMAAALRGASFGLPLVRSGARPGAAPARRLDSAAALFAAWWPKDAPVGWPPAISPALPPQRLRPAGIGRAALIEVWVNAVLPVALASGMWTEAECADGLLLLPSPGTYGKLRPLEAWLGAAGLPFSSAGRLQGGLLLHADYCTRGQCGRCPLSE